MLRHKRIGLAAALEFLHVNGVVTEMDNDEAVALVLDVILGKRNSRDAADFLRAHGKPQATDNDQSLHAAIAWMHRAYAPASEVLAQ